MTLTLFRVANMLLSAGALAFWVANMGAYWDGWRRNEKVVSSAVASLLASLAYLSGSAASNVISPTVRAALLAAPLGFLLLALVWDRRTHR